MDAGNVQVLHNAPLLEIGDDLIEPQQPDYRVCVHRRFYFNHAVGVTVIQLPLVTPR
ncbi:hypothetical protein D3C71_1978560 [compost metagenome]